MTSTDSFSTSPFIQGLISFQINQMSKEYSYLLLSQSRFFLITF